MATKNKRKPCSERKPRDHKTPSLRNLLEKPVSLETSCSIKLEKFPSIHEGSKEKFRKRTEDTERSRKRLNFPDLGESSRKSDVECFLKPDGFDVFEKVTGPSRCPSSFLVPPSDLDDHCFAPDRTIIEESKSLKNWDRWMRIRRLQNDRLSERMKRDKCELVMNVADEARKIREEKDLLAHAKIPSWDKWRGNPHFWKEPVALPERGMKSKYYVTETMSERGLVPPLEFVSVPDAVKMEKNVFCEAGKDFPGRTKECDKYRTKLREMTSHAVQGKDLVILGEKIFPDEKVEAAPRWDVPIIDVTAPEVEEEENGSEAVLVINGVEVKYPRDNDVEGSRCWSLTFEESPAGEVTEKVLRVENVGNIAFRYEWTRKREDGGQVDALRTTSGPCFFFDKNPGIFLPGEKRDLRFYHCSKNPGYHTEVYYIKLDPNPFGTNDAGKLRLTAVSGNPETFDDFLRIDSYLNSCVANAVVRRIVDEIFQRSRPEPPPEIEYRSLFMEEELFEFQNPAHYFRYDIADELKSLFGQIPIEPPQEWDMNLFTLEDLIRTYVTGKEQRSMLCKLMELSRTLLRPGPRCYKTNRKRNMLYNGLCCVIDDLEWKADRIREIFSRSEDDFAESEEEFTGSMASDWVTSLGEEASLSDKVAPERSVFAVSYRNLGLYQYALYTMFYRSMCEAAELSAGIIQSCRLFEHNGEVLMIADAGAEDDFS